MATIVGLFYSLAMMGCTSDAKCYIGQALRKNGKEGILKMKINEEVAGIFISCMTFFNWIAFAIYACGVMLVFLSLFSVDFAVEITGIQSVKNFLQALLFVFIITLIYGLTFGLLSTIVAIYQKLERIEKNINSSIS